MTNKTCLKLSLKYVFGIIVFTFQNFKVLKTLREKLISIGLYLFSIETNSTNSRIDKEIRFELGELSFE